METRKCQSNASTPQRLPQWSTGCLMFLQKWDAPCFKSGAVGSPVEKTGYERTNWSSPKGTGNLRAWLPLTLT